jgi:predicted permease
METAVKDIRYGFRMLLKKPGFTVVAILTFALGVGANSAIFTVVNAVLLRPLPFPESERVMAVGRSFIDSPQIGNVDDPRYLFWREQQQSFEAMSAHQSMGAGVNLSDDGEPEFIQGLRVSVDFFNVVGVKPYIGRPFTPQEDSASGERVAILSDSLWSRRYAADPQIIGRSVSLNGDNYTIVGVMPPDFQFTYTVDVFVPLRPGPGSGNSGYNFTVLARLKPAVTFEAAASEMKVIAEQLRAAQPNLMRRAETIDLKSFRETLTEDSSSLLWMLLGAVTFVLLIACANVANLQLTRLATRHREIAVRMALGASWWRIGRQLLIEGLLLSLTGGAIGVLIGLWATDLLKSLIPLGLIPRISEVTFDWSVLIFTLAIAVVSGVIFALAPVVQARRVDVSHALKESTGKGSAGAVRNRLRSILVVSEVALALVLLVGATLLIRTFSNLAGVAPGFDARNLLTFRLTPTGQRYQSSASTAEFYRNAIERLKRVPGVEDVAVTNILPLDAQYNLPFELSNKPNEVEAVQYRIITPGYFRLMKIGLNRGREFTENDMPATDLVAVVNEAFVRRYLNDADLFGQQLFVGRMFKLGLDKSYQIVGVVGDTKQLDLASAPLPTIFVPASQVPEALWKFMSGFRAMKFVIRTVDEPLGLAAAIRREMLSLEPTLPVTQIRSMDQVVGRSISQQRFNMLLVGTFAGLGLLLAAIGVYGVVSYTVSQRTNEIGIRMALGASVGDVFKLIITQGITPALIGIVIGTGGALALTRLMDTMLFGVSATDPLTFGSVAVLLVAAALVACILPARRAMRVDPMIALRYE